MTIKKILLVGNFENKPKVYTYATSFYKALNNLNYSVECFNYKNSRFNIPFIGKYLLDFYLIKLIKKCNPDLIFMIKAEKVSHKTLKKIKKGNPRIGLLNFYPDNPFTFWNGNSNSDVLLSLPLYDLFLIWSYELIPILYSAGSKNVQYFPFAFDHTLLSEDVKTINQDVKVYQSDVCFVGSWDPDREKWLRLLVDRLPDLRLAIWGNRWEENLSQNSILRSYLKGDAIYGIDMIKAFNLSKVVLNFIRKQNLDAHNMRTIEVPAVKAFLMTERTTEQCKMLFNEGQHLACFANIDELVQKIEFYLKNDNERLKIVQSGYEKVQEYKLENVLDMILKK